MSDIIPFTIPVDVPDGMELIGVARSCNGDEVLSPLTPEEVAAGFVYDAEKGTVTFYARDFCVFGFHMRKESKCDCVCDGPCSYSSAKPAPVVYKWKFTGKTTKGTPFSKSATVCRAPETSAVRTPTSYKLTGKTYICENCCCTGLYLGDEESFFTQVRPTRSDVAGQNLEMTEFNIIGKKGDKVEVSGKLEYTLDDPKTVCRITFSGIGRWDAKHQRVSSVSGKFAGIVTAPYYRAGRCGPALPAGVWGCMSSILSNGAKSVVTGSWSMKFDSSATKSVRVIP